MCHAHDSMRISAFMPAASRISRPGRCRPWGWGASPPGGGSALGPASPVVRHGRSTITPSPPLTTITPLLTAWLATAWLVLAMTGETACPPTGLSCTATTTTTPSLTIPTDHPKADHPKADHPKSGPPRPDRPDQTRPDHPDLSDHGRCSPLRHQSNRVLLTSADGFLLVGRILLACLRVRGLTFPRLSPL
jgi:hypothetical protein